MLNMPSLMKMAGDFWLCIQMLMGSGVFGGEAEEKRGADGNKLLGGIPTKSESKSKEWGKVLRDMLQVEIL